MLYWLAPVVAGVGYLAWRSWRRDLAIKSGELMDVRDLMDHVRNRKPRR